MTIFEYDLGRRSHSRHWASLVPVSCTLTRVHVNIYSPAVTVCTEHTEQRHLPYTLSN